MWCSYNCGNEGHISSECTEPRAERPARSCYKCEYLLRPHTVLLLMKTQVARRVTSQGKYNQHYQPIF